MPFNVILAQNAKVQGKRLKVGQQAKNVPDELFDELRRRGLVASFEETEASNDGQSEDNTSLAPKDLPGDTNGDGKLTIPEIKALLDARGVDYKGVTKLADLLALLEKSEQGGE